jgi:predicted unusual protein kinase regulating ubiquinone biosynthesis (AarF/ABC1/UbiB family)
MSGEPKAMNSGRDGDGDDGPESPKDVVGELLESWRASSSDGPSGSVLGRALRVSAITARSVTALASSRLRQTVAKHPEALRRVAHSRSAEQIVQGLGEMKGLAMKVGQMLSYVDHTVPPEAREVLSLLQTQSQPTDFRTVEQTIVEELGGAIADHFETFEETPIACASIGQVHRARLKSGEVVAVKIQHPGILEAIDADLRNASIIGRLKALALPRANVKGMIAELRARLLEECDYVHEADMQERFRAIVQGHETLIVPKVYRKESSKRVLTTEYFEGRTFQQFLADDPSQEERDRVGEALSYFYIGLLYEHGLFNADPHPGNYVFRDDGRVVMLDYGCVREFDVELLKKLRAMVLAVVNDDREAIHRASVDLGIVGPNVSYDREDARRLLRYLYAPMLHEKPSEITEEYTRQAVGQFLKNKNLFKLTMPGEMLLLNRVNFGLSSILVDLRARLDWKAHGLEYAQSIEGTGRSDPDPC